MQHAKQHCCCPMRIRYQRFSWHFSIPGTEACSMQRSIAAVPMRMRRLQTCVLRTRQRPMTARARSVRARTSPAGVPRCERSRACTCAMWSQHKQSVHARLV